MESLSFCVCMYDIVLFTCINRECTNQYLDCVQAAGYSLEVVENLLPAHSLINYQDILLYRIVTPVQYSIVYTCTS